MGRLGDFFPEHEKQEYVDRNLKPGQVLYLFCEFTTPQKEKYLVLTCAGARPLLFVINSEIRQFIARDPGLRRCQITLKVSDYDFLDHDSHIDCTNVVDCVSEKEIQDQILADVGRIKGELNADTKREIVRVVQSARTISPHHKNLIINSLK